MVLRACFGVVVFGDLLVLWAWVGRFRGSWRWDGGMSSGKGAVGNGRLGFVVYGVGRREVERVWNERV